MVVNVPKSDAYGVELESMWRPTQGLTLNLSYSYLVAKVTDMGGHCYQDQVDLSASQPGANTSGCASFGPGYQNLTGESLGSAARNKISVAASYAFNFDPGTLTVAGSAAWKQANYASVFNRSYSLVPDYTQVNLRATWKDAKDRYSVIAFVDNVFDKVNYDSVSGLTANSGVDRLASLTAPRTFGVEFQYRLK
jgi:iron complex outermembrane receptor protein